MKINLLFNFIKFFSGIAYLHTTNIFDRDLNQKIFLFVKLKLIKKINDRYFWIKIIDFGTAKYFEKK